ncbi:MAG: transposase [Bacteroidota bacterium]
MGKYKIYNQQNVHFLTLTVVGWIDVFTRAAYRDILIDSLKHCMEKKGLVIYAYVIMSNHVHLIAQSVSQKQTLSDIIRDFKSFTAKQINKQIQTIKTGESRREWLTYLFSFFARGNQRNRTFQFWQSDNHPIELWSPMS